MYLPQYTERKGSKSPENGQTERPDTLRNQQVMCSSHTTSSKKASKAEAFDAFLLQKLCACEKVYADTHDNNKIYERDDGSNKQVSAWERVRSITVGARAAHFLPCASQRSPARAARGIADDIVRHHQQEREKGEAKQQRQFEPKRLGERDGNNFKIRQQLIEKQRE